MSDCITDLLGMGNNFRGVSANEIYNMKGYTESQLEVNENGARHNIIMPRMAPQSCLEFKLFNLSNDDLKFDPKTVHNDWMTNVGITTDCNQEWKESEYSSNKNNECVNRNTVDK
tara:strand:- start:256 stop:600 length:345 start_codon:yes stop_codon:yes gene_type:complete